MNIPYHAVALLSVVMIAQASEKITPYKYTDEERAKGLKTYVVPKKSRFTVKRTDSKAPAIVCYFSVPDVHSFPIAVVCGGSSSKNDIVSIIHLHRYLLKDFLDLGIAVLTLEQWGADDATINQEVFMEHYTRSQRLYDHQAVIRHLQLNPPEGWNGKFIFLGSSEGGPLVTTLTTEHPADTIATINWCGAGDWSWQDQLWAFIEEMKNEIPWHIKLRMRMPKQLPFSIDFYIPNTRQEYDQTMSDALAYPVYDKEFMGMTYAYHADAMTYPKPDYHKIKTPFLVVAGAQDSIIDSSDTFVEKAKDNGVPITYFRVPKMDHYVRKHPEIVEQSFAWLAAQCAHGDAQRIES